MKNANRAARSFLLVVFSLALTNHPALAGLGGDAKSADSDMAALQGQISQLSSSGMSQSPAYIVKQFITARGTTVREFSAQAGPVFGIAWEGHRPPDLSILLGSYYPEYAKAAVSREHVSLHHAVYEGADITVITTGHMGHLSGRAYVPNLTPSGVDPQVVVK